MSLPQPSPMTVHNHQPNPVPTPEKMDKRKNGTGISMCILFFLSPSLPSLRFRSNCILTEGSAERAAIVAGLVVGWLAGEQTSMGATIVDISI